MAKEAATEVSRGREQRRQQRHRGCRDSGRDRGVEGVGTGGDRGVEGMGHCQAVDGVPVLQDQSQHWIWTRPSPDVSAELVPS